MLWKTYLFVKPVLKLGNNAPVMNSLQTYISPINFNFKCSGGMIHRHHTINIIFSV